MFYLILISEYKDRMCSDLIQDEEKDLVMSDTKSIKSQTISVELMVTTHVVWSERMTLWSEECSPVLKTPYKSDRASCSSPRTRHSEKLGVEGTG